MLRYVTAGESHGKCLIALIDGVPYGTPVSLEAVNAELQRRQGGYGRGARMKLEKDEAEILTGVRKGHTLGSPLTLQIANRVQNAEDLNPITRPRPGHADLAGAMKYGTQDARDVAERSSARETAARVAAGAFAGSFLTHFGIRVLGYVVEVGGISSDARIDDPDELVRVRDESLFYTLDRSLDDRIRARVDEARAAGDTLGGVFEVRVFGAPPGLGSHAGWEHKLDGALARALMSVQTVKAVEVGLGFEAARRPGSQMHDEIVMGPDGRLGRSRNNAGGIEGGMTNGQPVVVRAACKPISTLRKPLQTVDLASKEQAQALYERSDVCVVPAASVIGQAVVAFEIARAFLDKFGGDTFEETRRRHEEYRRQLERYGR
ncbi:MAG TPA: chorismate synthase [Planctomycetota bacterium]|jgi:chorismate synthase|nr:chorismate synthase [Planctomycetota bacterium]